MCGSTEPHCGVIGQMISWKRLRFLRCGRGSVSAEPHVALRSLRDLLSHRVPLFFLQCVRGCTSATDSCNKTTFGAVHILLRECVHSLCRCGRHSECSTVFLLRQCVGVVPTTAPPPPHPDPPTLTPGITDHVAGATR